jgi:hypothetical protein
MICRDLAGATGLEPATSGVTGRSWYVNTPNNVSIDAYCNADLSEEPLVINVPAQQESRWTIVQIGDCFDQVSGISAAPAVRERLASLNARQRAVLRDAVAEPEPV